jgi:Fe2+ transport system protein FeoA
MYPLNHSKAGEEIVVQCLNCHFDDVCRLNELGCVVGTNGTILSNQQNVILKVGESRLAINGNLAQRILVRPR